MTRTALGVALLVAAISPQGVSAQGPAPGPSASGTSASGASALGRSADEVVAIQRAADRKGRDALYRRLSKTRIDVHFEDLSPVELARFLMAATSNTVNFVVMSKQDIDPLTLRLKRVPVTTVMDIAQRFSKLRFVYTKGLVLIQHPDEVKEYMSLRVYDVRAATTPIPSFPGPELKLRAPGDEDEFGVEEEPDEMATASGFTADRMVDVIRANVLPDSWDKPGVSLSAIRGVLWVRQTDKGHRKVVEMLRKLGAISTPRLLRRGARPAAAKPSVTVQKRRAEKKRAEKKPAKKAGKRTK